MSKHQGRGSRSIWPQEEAKLSSPGCLQLAIAWCYALCLSIIREHWES